MNIKKVNKDRIFTEKELDKELIGAHTVLRNENWLWGVDEECILLITETAKQDIFRFIGWGDYCLKRNRVEQGGLLSGKYYISSSSGQKYAVVLRAFPMPDVVGTPGFWDAKAEDWKQADWEMTCYNREHGETLVSIGWFHTHPNDLPTFFSATDRYTQWNIFNNKYNFGIVLNPHRLSWKGFRSESASDTCCQILDTDDLDSLIIQTDKAGFEETEKPAEKKDELAVQCVEPDKSSQSQIEELLITEDTTEKSIQHSQTEEPSEESGQKAENSARTDEVYEQAEITVEVAEESRQIAENSTPVDEVCKQTEVTEEPTDESEQTAESSAQADEGCEQTEIKAPAPTSQTSVIIEEQHKVAEEVSDTDENPVKQTTCLMCDSQQEVATEKESSSPEKETSEDCIKKKKKRWFSPLRIFKNNTK